MAVRIADDFHAQNLANTVWAFSTLGLLTAPLCAALSKKADTLIDQFETHSLANMARAFTTTAYSDPSLYAAWARAAVLRAGRVALTRQELTDTAWTFAVAGRSDIPLFATLAGAAESRVWIFDEKGIATLALAFAAAGYSDVPLFASLARATQRRT